MTTKAKPLITNSLYSMDKDDINHDELLQRCTINHVMSLTGITRPTLYKWLNESVELEKMNPRDCAWFITMCETNPKIIMLLQRGPFKYPRLAKQWLDDQPVATQGTK